MARSGRRVSGRHAVQRVRPRRQVPLLWLTFVAALGLISWQVSVKVVGKENPTNLASPLSSPATPSPTHAVSPRGSASARSSAVALQLQGMPPPLSSTDVYAADRPGNLSPLVRNDRPLVYVPNTNSNTVTVIDQRTMTVINTFPAGHEPQHVVPSYDLRTLYVAADYVPTNGGKGEGSLTPIDPRTGTPGTPIPVEDPYNLYFTPDGKYGIVVAEARQRLDFYDPHTWRLHDSLALPSCAGVDHLDFTADGRTLLASCEFADQLITVDVATHHLLSTVRLPRRPQQQSDGMPQDVKLSPDGKVFYVADMVANGVYIIDAATTTVIGFIATGLGTHGLYIDRTSTRMFATNRGEGSISIIDLATRAQVAKWRIPGGGSPDMGNLSADGKVLWLSGRYNGVVYAIDANTGQVLKEIPVGAGPHGLTVWPQPGRYSLGHTGIMR